ncbi:Alkylated DNA repair protein alkB 8, partial [Choanephora cucurbitarum]
ETQVPGLLVIKEFVNKSEELELIDAVDKQPWSGLGIGEEHNNTGICLVTDIGMALTITQMGHSLNSATRKVLEEYGPLPEFSQLLVDRIMQHQLMPNIPNHLLVNEYNAGQGIMPHIDAPALFGPAILSLSLLSDCIMKFTLEEKEVDVVLPRRSIAVLTGDARYTYKHSISKDLVETTPDGTLIHRDRRVSFTFREIIAWEVPS